MKCLCGANITLSKKDEVLKCENCGRRYMLEVGDFSDVVETVMDILNVISREEMDEVKVEKVDGNWRFKYKDKEIIAKLIEEDPEYFLHEWVLFFS